MGACRLRIFFWPSTLKSNDFLCFDEIQFVTLAWKGGEGSDYLFCWFLQTTYFSGEGILLTGDGVIICFVVCLLTTYFHYDRSMQRVLTLTCKSGEGTGE